MILIDENFPDSQRQLLQGWRISFKQVGFEIGREGLKDDEIIPLLHQLNKPTFFTLDREAATRRALEGRRGGLPMPNSGGLLRIRPIF